MSELLNWGRNNGYSSTMRNSRSMLRGGVSPNQVGMNSMQTNGFNPATAARGDGPGFMDGLLGYTDAEGMETPGWGGMGISAASSLFNGWLGMKQLGVAQDELKENKRQFNMNWGAQKKTTNAELADRQRRRVSAGGGAQPVDQYMDKWGIE